MNSDDKHPNSATSQQLADFYDHSYKKHGFTHVGAGWGANSLRLRLRFLRLLALFEHCENDIGTVLDVGCGYGELYSYIRQRDLKVNYTGIDTSSCAIQHGKESWPNEEFLWGDFLVYPCIRYDYVVTNGILTLKAAASNVEMEEFSKAIIKKMWATCTKGIAFNMMSTYVERFDSHLFYKSPVELLAWLTQEVTANLKIDMTYNNSYEFTVYCYKESSDE